MVDTQLRLINAEGREVARDAIIRVTMGPDVGKAYVFSGVIKYRTTYRVKCTRKTPHAPYLRGVDFFHPSAFDCHVQAPLTLCQRFKYLCHYGWSHLGDWVMAGVVALVPLAMFEHFHMASKITEVVSLGMFGGGH